MVEAKMAVKWSKLYPRIATVGFDPDGPQASWQSGEYGEMIDSLMEMAAEVGDSELSLGPDI